jgi:hypothetical protein
LPRQVLGDRSANKSKQRVQGPGIQILRDFQRVDAQGTAAPLTGKGRDQQKTMLRQIELWGEKIIPAIRKEVESMNAVSA